MQISCAWPGPSQTWAVHTARWARCCMDDEWTTNGGVWWCVVGVWWWVGVLGLVLLGLGWMCLIRARTGFEWAGLSWARAVRVWLDEARVV